MGSIGAIPLYLLLAYGGRWSVGAGALVVTGIGVWAASVVARESKQKDPQIVVVDEVAGMLVTLLPLPEAPWPGVIAGLALFRLFDVVKPWPVRGFERLRGGWGIVLDDVAAGVLGAAVMAGLRGFRVLP
jgi:phosphatidylglycerophosphatase A